MSDHTPAALMPKWWRVFSATLLYAAYALWLIPVGLYVWGGDSLLAAILWFAVVVVAQFALVKLIALVEYLSTANEIERLRAAQDELAHSGDKN